MWSSPFYAICVCHQPIYAKRSRGTPGRSCAPPLPEKRYPDNSVERIRSKAPVWIAFNVEHAEHVPRGRQTRATVGGERLVVKRPLLHTSHMEAQGARVVRHVLTCPVTRGQVAYDACSSCVSHVGVREAGVVRHLLTCPVTRGQMAYDTCSTCQCFLFGPDPGLHVRARVSGG